MKEKKIKNITENWSIWGCRGYCGQFLHHSNNWEIERAELIYISFRKKMRALESEDAIFEKCLSIQENRSHISCIALSFETNKKLFEICPQSLSQKNVWKFTRKLRSLQLFIKVNITHGEDPFHTQMPLLRNSISGSGLAPGDQRCKMDIGQRNPQTQFYIREVHSFILKASDPGVQTPPFCFVPPIFMLRMPNL